MRLLLPLLLAACATARVRAGDVESAFVREAAALRLRVPTRADLDPARAANAPRVMTETERAARAYLERNADAATTPANYVRALLACALLAQGRADEARAALGDIRRRREDLLSPENMVITAALHAVGASRAVAARRAVGAMFDGELDIPEFLVSHGTFVGVSLPDEEARDYELVLSREVTEIRMSCFKRTGLEEARLNDNRAELRRLVAEQFYNDAASLLVLLEGEPQPQTAVIERWLAQVAVAAFVVHGYLISDIMPYRLTEEQMQWQLEQILPTYERARAAAGRFLPAAVRAELDRAPLPLRDEADPKRQLYGALRGAEIAVRAWIETR